MPKLVWNKIGERRYEKGVDRGVLYLPDGSGVAWNGLTGVTEDFGEIETTELYFDGVKYNEIRTTGDYSGTLTAFTYPEEFEQFEGVEKVANGLRLAHQPVTQRFGLSYRIRIGNDTDGLDHGYKIHILYNLIAIPSSRPQSTLSGQTDLSDFSWTIKAVPEHIPGHRPTAHIIVDTTKMNPFLIADIENLLYGKDPVARRVEEKIDGGSPSSAGFGTLDGQTPESPGSDVIDGGDPFGGSNDPVGDEQASSSAKLPPIADLVALIEQWTLIPITDNGDGTWTATAPDEFIRMIDSTTFEIVGANAKYLDPNTYQISTTHGF